MKPATHSTGRLRGEAKEREAYQDEDQQQHARAISLSGLVFFGATLLAHWLVVQRMTGWLVPHIIFVGMCAAFVVQVWIGVPKDETKGTKTP